jgi:uncharacterized protein (TIGR00730 family)
MRSICVYCGSSPGANPAYGQAANELGEFLARSRRRLVYGGGNVGLMGIVADAALAAGGEVIGVIPHSLVARELAHDGLTELKMVDWMHQRKAQMADLADGFIALPGGLGTLEELFEVWTWGQLGLHGKPVGLLNINGFFDPLLTFLERLVTEKFVRRENREMLFVETAPTTLIERMETYHAVEVPKWLGPGET